MNLFLDALNTTQPTWDTYVRLLAEDPSPELRAAALRTLISGRKDAGVSWGPDQGRLLRQLLRSSDPVLVVMAIRGLKKAPAEEGFPLIESFVTHPDPKVRLAVAESLGPGPIPMVPTLCSRGQEKAVALLKAMATDPDPQVRWRVLLMLSRLDALPDDVRFPETLWPEDARDLAWDGLVLERRVWADGFEVPILAAIKTELSASVGLPGELAANNVISVSKDLLLVLGTWLLQGDPGERTQLLREWLEGEDGPSSRVGAVLLGLAGGDGLGLLETWAGSTDFHRKRLGLMGMAASMGNAGRVALLKLMDESTQEGRQDAIDVLRWRAGAGSDPVAFTTLAWMQAESDPQSEDPEAQLFGHWTESSHGRFRILPSLWRGIPNGPLSRFILPDDLFAEGVMGVPAGFRTEARASLGMLRSGVPSLREFALGTLVFCCWRLPWLDDLLAKELDAPETAVRRLAILHLKLTGQWARLAEVAQREGDALLGIDHITSSRISEDPGWSCVLLGLLSHPHLRVRLMALEGLRQSTSAAITWEVQGNTLKEALADSSLACAAAKILMYHPVPGTLDLLVASLAKLEPWERNDILGAILACPDPGSVEVFLDHWPGGDPHLMDGLANEIVRIKPHGLERAITTRILSNGRGHGFGALLGGLSTQEALDGLTELAGAQAPSVRSQAIDGLVCHGSASAWELLAGLTDDSSRALRLKALRALGCWPDPRATEVFLRHLADPCPGIRRAAARGLLQGDPQKAYSLVRSAVTRALEGGDQAGGLPFGSMVSLATVIFREARIGPWTGTGWGSTAGEIKATIDPSPADSTSSALPGTSKLPLGRHPLLAEMKSRGIPLTRENYLALAHPDLALGDALDPELEAELPREFQLGYDPEDE